MENLNPQTPFSPERGSNTLKVLIVLGVILIVAGIFGAVSHSPESTQVTEQQVKQSTQIVVANVPAGVSLITSIDFPMNYDHVAFAVEQDNKAFVITDTKISPSYDEIVWGPYFRPTSLSDGYAQWGSYTGPLSPAYMARTGKVISLFVDNKEEISYEDVDRYGATLLKDGSVVFRGTRNGKQYVYLRGQEYGPYDQVRSDDYVISPDGDHVAYVAQRREKEIVVLDGKEQKAYGAVSEIIFAPDGTLGYFATLTKITRQNTSPPQILIVNGQEISTNPFTGDNLSSPALCAGSKGDYQFTNGGKCEQRNSSDETFTSLDATMYYSQPSGPNLLANDPNAKRYEVTYGYLPIIGGPTVFIAASGKVTNSTPQGESAYYTDHFVVIDGKEGVHFSEVFWPLVLSADGTEIMYGAYDASTEKLVRVVQKIR